MITYAAGLSAGRYGAAGFSNNAVAGYVSGGYNGSSMTGTDKISFPVDTRTTLSAPLTVGRNGCTGFANSGTAGYVAGGYTGSIASASIDKFALPADTVTTLSAPMTGGRYSFGSFANGSVAGYLWVVAMPLLNFQLWTKSLFRQIPKHYCQQP